MTTDDRWGDYLDPGAEDPTLDRADRAYLDRTRRTLSDPATWDGPPLELEDRLLELAAVTPQEGLHAPDAEVAARADGPRRAVAAPTPDSTARRNRFRVLAVAVAAAAAAAVFAVVVPQVGQQPQIEHYAMAGTPLAPQARASVDIESKSAGDAITLHISGLPPAPPGSYYAGWLTGPAGTVPVGTFHWRKGGIPIELWSGVDTVAYPDFVITLQREGQSPTPSDQVVLTGSLRP